METKIPKCIGIMLDGNRRWAREKGISQLEGHRMGLQTFKEAVFFIRDRKIEHLVVYMFSTENWNRDSKEVSYLMDLFREAIKTQVKSWQEEGVRVRFVGQRERFSPDIQEAMKNAEDKTAHNSRITLWACLSYGGREEIVIAANKASTEGQITEESLARNLWTSGMPDPDIIIRTGGEQRLSGFLPWQSVYSELFFIEEKWPDFSEKVLDRVLNEYAERERRMGK